MRLRQLFLATMCAGGLLTANAQDNFISRYIATNDSLERAINEDQEL